jgi:hypothetical protein
MDGTNADMKPIFSVITLVEWKFTDMQMTSPQYRSDNMLLSAVFNNISIPRGTAVYMFKNDNTICGDRENVW